MALKSTIFRANLNGSDLDRGHFAEYPLTIARHPSETDERMMVRVLSDLYAFQPEAQPDDGVTYASKIEKSEARRRRTVRRHQACPPAGHRGLARTWSASGPSA